MAAVDAYAAAETPGVYRHPDCARCPGGELCRYPGPMQVTPLCDLALDHCPARYRDNPPPALGWNGYGDWTRGILPETGGLLDQAAIWVDTVRACASIDAQARAYLASQAREAARRSQTTLRP